jgi:hypothetical protein
MKFCIRRLLRKIWKGLELGSFRRFLMEFGFGGDGLEGFGFFWNVVC